MAITNRNIARQGLFLLPLLAVGSVAHAASEVTGTLNAGSGSGSGTTGTLTGTSGGGSVTGTVTGGSGGGGGGGNGGGSVLGASTGGSGDPDGSVLGAFTGAPNTGLGGDGIALMLLVLTAAIITGVVTYFASRKVAV